MNNVIVKSSTIAGRGIFASKDLKKGDTILIVDGPVIKYPFLPDWRVGMNHLNIGPNMWKIAYRDNPWNFINHSCSPNSGLLGKTKVVAMSKIKKGQEVTIDYSCTEASTSQWRMKCNCHTKECRKLIRSIQFLPSDLFKKYKKYIPKFLQREYLAQKVYVEQLKNGSEAVFAKDRIRKGDILFTVKGPTIRYSKAPHPQIGLRWLGIAKNVWIIPQRQNPWWSMRHSCRPNVGLKNKTQVVAMRGIASNEEITIDDSITEADPNWKFVCHCKSQHCRKVVRSIQYLPKSLFQKYKPFIPEVFQKIYTEK